MMVMMMMIRQPRSTVQYRPNAMQYNVMQHTWPRFKKRKRNKESQRQKTERKKELKI